MLLANAFIDKFKKKTGKDIKGIEPKAAELLATYGWPGNVRELENVIERAIILCRNEYIGKNDLLGLTGTSSQSNQKGNLVPLAEIEKNHIKYVLDRMNWSISASSEKLGIHRNTLRSKIKEYNLLPPEK